MSELHRYFRQQKERYGDDLYIDEEVLRRAALASQGLTEVAGAVAESWTQATDLAELESLIHDCVKCPLGETRNKFVFGVGNPQADVVIVGEAPGAEEDKRGEPFVGRAGQLLDKILEAVRFTREDVFICNILKCRPPNNRDPQASEVEQCEPYLHRQLALLQPKIMLALGRIAAQTLLRSNDSLTKLRESVHEYQGIPLVVTYHPAALLRNPNWKRPTWEDVQKFRALYDEIVEAGRS
jgi:DNA polymerase